MPEQAQERARRALGQELHQAHELFDFSPLAQLADVQYRDPGPLDVLSQLVHLDVGGANDALAAVGVAGNPALLDLSNDRAALSIFRRVDQGRHDPARRARR